MSDIPQRKKRPGTKEISWRLTGLIAFCTIAIGVAIFASVEVASQYDYLKVIETCATEQLQIDQ